MVEREQARIVALMRAGDVAQAGAAIDELLSVEILAPVVLLGLAQQALQMSRFRLAARCAEQALAQDVLTDRQRLQASSVLVHGRQYDRAIQTLLGFGDGLQRLPDGQNLLAYCYSAFGNFAEAEPLYQAILAQVPDHSFAIAGLAKCRKFGADARPLIEKFTAALSERQPPMAQARIHHAIAKLQNDIGEYDAAWTSAAAANALMRQIGDPMQVEKISHFVAQMIADYPQRNWPSADNTAGQQHVLVVGMPRSGTTLVEQILAAHPGYFSGGEVPALEHAQLQLRATSTPQTSPLNRAASAYLTYFDEFDAVAGRRIINKVPGNFLNVGFFKQMFPAGKIIYVQRDVRDVAASVFFEHFSEQLSYTTSVADTLQVQQQCARIMAFWAAQFPDDVIALYYEDLVYQHEQSVQHLANALGLERSEMLAHTAVRNAVETPSHWQVRQGIYSSSIERWRRYAALVELLTPKT